MQASSRAVVTATVAAAVTAAMRGLVVTLGDLEEKVVSQPNGQWLWPVGPKSRPCSVSNPVGQIEKLPGPDPASRTYV